MNARSLLLPSLVVLLLWPASLTAQPTVTGPSFKDVIALRNVGTPSISPDGRRIVFNIGVTDWKENRYDSELWLAREGEEPFQLTRTKEGSSTGARWSPDGKWIAFLADRGEKRQIHVIRAAGGEAQAVTHGDEGVGSFRWSPDGARIAYTQTEPESKAMKQRKEKYGAFDVEDADYRVAHLWVIDVVTDPWPSPVEAPCADDAPADSLDTPAVEECARHPEPRRLTEGDDFTVSSFAWSPDGTRIAFEHRDDPLINSWMTADISVLDVETGAIEPLVERPSYDGNPIWSPDGAWILFSTSGENMTSNFYKNDQIAKIPSTGGALVPLAEDFDEDIGNLRWTPRGIFFLGWQKTKRHLFEIDPETGATSLAADTPRLIRSIDFSQDGNTVALRALTATTLDEIYRTSMDDFQPEIVTAMTRQIDGWEIGTSEVISWTSEDGATIEGVLFKPPNFDPNTTYPLLVTIHGGPTGIDYPTPIDSYVYPIPQWLAKGAVVLQPNYRGSAGYGEAFRELNVRNLGVGDAWDVLSGVDHLIDQGFIDPERMGAMGWSQGGYISAFLTTHTDRFAAISVGAGISNWMTYYVNTDIHPFTRQYLKATPWEDNEIYLKTSPMTTITQAQTPTLIQHGEFDRRVPIPNAYELFQGLQDVGVETKLIVYKGFGHGINKPKERLAATWHNWQWFARHIWGEDVEIPVEAEKEATTESGR